SGGACASAGARGRAAISFSCRACAASRPWICRLVTMSCLRSASACSKRPYSNAGTIKKTADTTISLTVTEDRIRSGLAIWRPFAPPITEPWHRDNSGGLVVHIAELLPDALDQGANVGAVAFRAGPGDEALALQHVVELAVADVAVGAR